MSHYLSPCLYELLLVSVLHIKEHYFTDVRLNLAKPFAMSPKNKKKYFEERTGSNQLN